MNNAQIYFTSNGHESYNEALARTQKLLLGKQAWRAVRFGFVVFQGAWWLRLLIVVDASEFEIVALSLVFRRPLSAPGIAYNRGLRLWSSVRLESTRGVLVILFWRGS